MTYVPPPLGDDTPRLAEIEFPCVAALRDSDDPNIADEARRLLEEIDEMSHRVWLMLQEEGR
jgi:hypothetical protein